MIDSADCSPLDALRLKFETAESTPPLLAPRKKVATPKIECSPELATALSSKKASGFFGVNHNGFPKFTVAEQNSRFPLRGHSHRAASAWSFKPRA